MRSPTFTPAEVSPFSSKSNTRSKERKTWLGEGGAWPLLLAYNFGHFAYLLDADGVSGELHFHRCWEPTLEPYTTKISSGSGSPAFAVINGEPVLVGCLHTTGSTSWIADHEEAINTLLASLGSTQRLTTFDLSKPVAYARY